jgi:hypothetical protein
MVPGLDNRPQRKRFRPEFPRGGGRSRRVQFFVSGYVRKADQCNISPFRQQPFIANAGA